MYLTYHDVLWPQIRCCIPSAILLRGDPKGRSPRSAQHRGGQLKPGHWSCTGGLDSASLDFFAVFIPNEDQIYEAEGVALRVSKVSSEVVEWQSFCPIGTKDSA